MVSEKSGKCQGICSIPMGGNPVLGADYSVHAESSLGSPKNMMTAYFKAVRQQQQQ